MKHQLEKIKDEDNICVSDVLILATQIHKGEKRKYSLEDYIFHPISVSMILQHHGCSNLEICGGLLHDTIETAQLQFLDFNENHISDIFSPRLGEIVKYCTKISKPSDGNREIRTNIDILHYSKGPVESKNIKAADAIHNLSSLKKYDASFAKKYAKEKSEMLTELYRDPRVNTSLFAHAFNVLND